MVSANNFPLISIEAFKRLSYGDQKEYNSRLKEWMRRKARRRFYDFYPETGPLRRELYAKHMEFFAKGAEYRERCALCANRIGKTEGMGGYECSAHLTGHYPDWWVGHRFRGPIRCWIAGKTNETTRDILQAKMFGDTVHLPNGRKGVTGTGMVPGDDIGEISWKRGSDLIDKAPIKHVDKDAEFDGWSIAGLKSYEQGRGSFEGTEQDLIWVDEEPPLDVYVEMLTRTMTTHGLVMVTFTPLEGMSEVVLQFLPGGKMPETHQNNEVPDERPNPDDAIGDVAAE